ncbi:MAG: two-component regulator propeller domain-containing protein [bacterium]
MIKLIYKSIFLVLAFLQSYPVFGHGQSYIFENLNSEDGLSENSVVVIYQDSKQFLWFGTFNALNRYDGYSFKIYKSLPDDSTTISSHTVTSICEDESGNLWIGTLGGGVARYNRATDNFKRYQNIKYNNSSLSNDRVKTMLIDSRGDLWIGTEYGLNKYDKKSGKFIRYYSDEKNPNSICSNFISSLCEDDDGNLWIGTWSGVDKLDLRKNQIIHYSNDGNNPLSLSSNQITKIFRDNKKRIWIATYKGLNKFDEMKNCFVRYLAGKDRKGSLSNNVVSDIIQNKQGMLCLATLGGGLNIFDPETGIFVHYRNNPYDPTSISNDVLYSLYEDRSGILWIGTSGSGISKIDPVKNQFISYKFQPENSNTLSNNKVFSLCVDRSGIVWIGTYGGGLNRFDPKSKGKSFSCFRHDPKYNTSLGDDKIICVYEDREGLLWIGTENGLDKFDSKKKRFVHFNRENSPGLTNNSIFSLLETRNGDFWVGTYDGLHLYNKKNNSFRSFRNDPVDTNSIINNFVRMIYEDRTGMIWLCTDKGLDRYDPIAKKFLHFGDDPSDLYRLNDKMVLNIFEDREGNLWVGTITGLYKLNRSQNNNFTIRHLGTKDGLPDNNIQGIIEDNSGNLWISTNKGLTKFDRQNGGFKNFNTNHGLPSDEFYVNSLAKLQSTGDLIFGGVNGVTMFNPNNIKDDLFVAPVVFTDLKISNSSAEIGKFYDDFIILPRSVSEMNEITLSYKTNIISFEYSLLHFSAPMGNSYAYRLEGLENDWNHVGNSRYATYTYLPPGEYIFRVKGANNSGIWSPYEAAIKIIVKPPFWQTWWFRSGVLLFIVLIIYLAYVSRVSTIEKRRKQLETLNKQLSIEVEERHQKEIELLLAKDRAEKSDRLKSEFLAQMSHEIRTPINAILSFTSLLREEVHDKIPDDLGQSFSIIDNAGNRLIRTIDLILNMSQVQTDTYEINFKKFDLYYNVIEILETQYRHVANDRKLKLLFSREADDTIIYADEYTVMQIFENLLNNAIKYTPEGKVEIRLRRDESNKLIVEVNDTGIGISESFLPELFKPFSQEDSGYTRRFEGNGLGLALVKKYVELNNAEIEVKSKKGIGTTFLVSFPASN